MYCRQCHILVGMDRQSRAMPNVVGSVCMLAVVEQSECIVDAVCIKCLALASSRRCQAQSGLHA
jgi:hypothetical protein